jgi:hypothetical protein
MKTLRHFFAAFLLVLMLTGSLYAGVISTPIAPPNPAPAPTTEGATTTSVNGVISTPNAEPVAASGSVTETALSLIQSVLSLF